MTLLIHRLLASAAMLAVASAQLLGVQRGFVCVHGESVIETMAEHCHEELLNGHGEEIPCAAEPGHDCEGKGEKQRHKALSVKLLAARSSIASVSTPSFIAIPVPDFFVDHFTLTTRALEPKRLLPPPLAWRGGCPSSAAVQVARCMVILV